MKLKARTAQEIANKCAEEMIATYSEQGLAKMPYDVLAAEMAEMTEDIEDKLDRIISSKIDEQNAPVNDIEDIWDEE